MNVGVVGNPRYRDLAPHLAGLSRLAPRLDLTLHAEPDLADLLPHPVPALDGRKLDLLVTFGGDGTLLRGARRLQALGQPGTPILGVNLGRVGFLTTARPETLAGDLEAVARGAYEIETRATLDTTIARADGSELPSAVALNDVVVHKAGVARVILLRVSLDNEEIGHYRADGIIVATPTGSTAYSMSAGGPIVLNGVDALVITAICPHTLAVRPIVVPGSSTVTIEVIPPVPDDVWVSYDGQIGTELQPNDRVLVRRGASPVRLVRLEKEGFFARMRRKLQWGELRAEL